MPIYEYECRRCQRRLETMQRLSDPPLTECPECGGELRKLVSAPAFQFKGSGWYVTDYARKGGDAAGKGEAGKGGDAKASDASGDKGGDKTGDKGGGGDKGGDAKPAGKDSAPSTTAGAGKAASGGSSG